MRKILFERSGGVMGRKVSLELDLETMVPDQADNLNKMLKEANFFKLPESFMTRPVPDAFTYSITVKTTWRQHSVRFSDATIPTSLQPLVDEMLSWIRNRS